MSAEKDNGASGVSITEGKVHRLVITYVEGVQSFDFDGGQVPPWVALGMLEYAEILVRRVDVQREMAVAMANRPRVVSPWEKH